MTLRELFGDAAPAAPGVDVRALAYDNRAVTPGTAFVCVPGFTRDGHEFAADAIARGAVALVVERPLGLGVPEVLVPDARAAMAPAAARLAGDPTARLRVVGITGTNGKTTTAFLLASLLEAGGLRTGLLGTVTQIVGGERTPAVRTTPEAVDLQATFAQMLACGDRACVMEVSSHALELHRADAIHWAAAVFTNLSQDHLDFHDTMEDYFQAKRLLFLADPALRVVNTDDPYGRRLAEEFPDALTVGIDSPHAALRATDVVTGLGGSSFRAGGLELRTSMPGRFNVLNALCAVAVARALGVDDAAIVAALPRAGRAPGRFEPVDEGQDFALLVDYAHTPDSLENVLRAARGIARGRVIVVFGCGGDRDRGKRPVMGAIAAREADAAIVTSDNPRSENPEAIIGQILDGIPADPRADVEAIADRRAAIARAIDLAGAGDVVVVAGKGHEQGQEIAGGVTLDFDDVAVARAALRKARG
ncbi:MAG TPA: UDP-N-acetylmuramoyl-L-alanyl-D-glutamate--2,6-diaminopimelate ligase [Solirubrobacteraceae bacterium]|nr:UDP-N-acetylmuramoyl-L-alanyl-D-glutamate--2,6-diaminopimelate ligase [Solirubrobacteraceae bacterium]